MVKGQLTTRKLCQQYFLKGQLLSVCNPGKVFRLILLLVFKLGISNSAFSQHSYPALTANIKFDELVRQSIVREVKWTNPDGFDEKMKMTEMSIPVGDSLKKLTNEFMLANYGLNSIWLKPRIIVFHAMGDGDLKISLEVSSFLNDEIPASWGNLSKAGKLPNGAHFIIDKDGKIICLTPPVSSDGSHISYEKKDHKWIIKRQQDANPIAIGVENVTDRGKFTELTPQQLNSNAKLARWLLWMEGNKINYLTSHHQFNSDVEYDFFLNAFGLRHLQKEFRTRERKDIGDVNLRKIIDLVKGYGCDIHSFFELK